MNKKTPPMNLVTRIEATARDGFARHGRGLVVCAQNGKDTDVFFVPTGDVGQIFAEHLKDREFARWLRTYDSDQEYILMDAFKVNEAEAEAQPYLCHYRKTVSA